MNATATTSRTRRAIAAASLLALALVAAPAPARAARAGAPPIITEATAFWTLDTSDSGERYHTLHMRLEGADPDSTSMRKWILVLDRSGNTITETRGEEMTIIPGAKSVESVSAYALPMTEIEQLSALASGWIKMRLFDAEGNEGQIVEFAVPPVSRGVLPSIVDVSADPRDKVVIAGVLFQPSSRVVVNGRPVAKRLVSVSEDGSSITIAAPIADLAGPSGRATILVRNPNKFKSNRYILVR
jgi:hypothetical protein